MALRGDIPEWTALARRLGARRILDLGSGDGRVGAAIRSDDPKRLVVGVDITAVLARAAGPPGEDQGPRRVLGDMRALPFAARSFDLIVAANDPFAHLLRDAERAGAVRESIRASRSGGRVVIDGLWLPPADREAARGELVRERRVGDVALRERWHAIGSDLYSTVYEYRRGTRVVGTARTPVRAWRLDEPALRLGAARIEGGLRGEPFEERRARLVITFEVPS
jgi:SAM-dependent methyltransferase